MSNAAEDFLRRAAARSIRQDSGGTQGGREPCVAVAVREELRPSDQGWVDAMMEGVSQRLAEAGCRAILLYGYTDDVYWTLGEYIDLWGVDAMVLASNHEGDPLPGLLLTAGFPMVAMGVLPGYPQVPYVDVDNYSSGRVAAEHLLAHGRRHVVVLSGPRSFWYFDDRARGACEALSDAGVLQPDLLVTTENSPEAAGHAIVSLLESGRRVDGVVTATDVMAMGVLAALSERGVRVPDEIAVVSHDDSPCALTSHPTLTTVRQSIADMGYATADLVLDVMAGSVEGPHRVYLKTELVRRESA